MQTKIAIQQHLSVDCQAFVDLTDCLTEEQFHIHTNDKWSVAEVMQHLYLSARPVARLMTGPREVLKQWGVANLPSRDYAEIASTYTEVLATGVKAPAAMSPRVEDIPAKKSELVTRFATIYQSLLDAVGTWSDQELDSYCIPHPVLGKLTVREMLIFTSVHTQHHLKSLLTP